MKHHILFILLFCSNFLVAQTYDLTVLQSNYTPQSGCDLDQEVLMFSFQPANGLPYNGPIEVGYSINSGTPVTYNTSIFNTAWTQTWTFPNLVDFSSCQIYDVAVWFYFPDDVNNSNDTLYFQVTSDCSSTSASLEPSDNCYTVGDTVYLNNYNGNITTWSESSDNGTSWSTTTSANNWFIPTNGIPNLVRATVESPFGICEPDTILFNIPLNNFLSGVNAGSDTTIFINDSIQLNGAGGTTFAWYPEYNMNDSTLSNPWIWPNTSTLYYLESSDGGCTGLDSVLITVIDNSQIPSLPANDLLISNLITPQNGNWNILGIEKYPQNSLLVYNLNGQLVYSASPYVNQLQSDYLNAGTYIYMLDLNWENQLLRGRITVVR